MKDQFGLGKMRTKLHDLSLFQHCCPEPRLANGCAFPTVQLLACLRPSRVTLALTPTQPSPAVPPVHAVPQVAVRTDLLCGGALPCRCTRRKLDHKEALSGRAPSLQSPRLRQARDRPCAPPDRRPLHPFLAMRLSPPGTACSSAGPTSSPVSSQPSLRPEEDFPEIVPTVLP